MSKKKNLKVFLMQKCQFVTALFSQCSLGSPTIDPFCLAINLRMKHDTHIETDIHKLSPKFSCPVIFISKRHLPYFWTNNLPFSRKTAYLEFTILLG